MSEPRECGHVDDVLVGYPPRWFDTAGHDQVVAAVRESLAQLKGITDAEA